MTHEEIRHEIVALKSTLNTLITSKTAVLLSQSVLMNEPAYERQEEDLNISFEAIDTHLELAVHSLFQAIHTLSREIEQ